MAFSVSQLRRNDLLPESLYRVEEICIFVYGILPFEGTKRVLIFFEVKVRVPIPENGG